jgi:hypothetical protein
MADQTVIKFNVDGPAAGLSDWDEIPKQEIQSGHPGGIPGTVYLFRAWHPGHG